MPVTLHIDGLAAGGEGVARLDGRVVFVAGAAPQETVEAELFEEKERSARAHLTRIILASPERTSPTCPHYHACGGCPWMHLSLPAQQGAKQTLFREALARIGEVDRQRLRLNPLIASPRPLRYRQRATLHLSGGELGYHAPASHALVKVSQCLQLQERLEAALLRLAAALAKEGAVKKCADLALACDETRVSAAFFVALSSRAAMDRVERLVRAAGLDGAVVVAEGGRGQLVGEPRLSFPAPLADGVTLFGRADLFAQANPEANTLLVAEAMRLLGPQAGDALELFSGSGNFTFAMTRRGLAVTAIESCADAVELARRSAREAGVQGARFILGDALASALALAREGRRFDTLLLDPPRAGAKGVGRAAAACGVRRVVYVSCDPATLARDVKELSDHGFHLIEATPVDMFPQTFHLEAVAALER